MMQGNEFNNLNKVVKWAGISEFLVNTTDAVNGHLFNFDLDGGKDIFLFLVYVFFVLVTWKLGVLFLFICHFSNLSERNR